ncbi:flagellar biosynthesis protein FlhB [Clostridium sp. DL1XJH146]
MGYNDLLFLNIISLIIGILFFNIFLNSIKVESIDFRGNIAVKRKLSINFMFMADDKTEDPTPKKLEDARKKGQIAKSQDLNSALQLFIFTLVASSLGNYIYNGIYSFFKSGFRVDYNMSFSNNNVNVFLKSNILSFISIIFPVFGVLFLAALVINLAQTKFNYSLHPIKPDFKKLNPIEGFKKIFSKKALFGLLKNLAKLALVTYISYSFIKDNIFEIQGIALTSVYNFYTYLGDILGGFISRVATILVIIGIIDFVYQKYDFKKSLKMTKHEVKEEYKEVEGDPIIKSQRKQKQKQLAMNRMMADVEKADAVIVNPTHISVAIRYDEKEESAPRVLAKGADNIALKIRTIAKEKNIPIVENKPLARLLYKKVKVGQQVPVEYYGALAEILAFVYKLEQKKKSFYKSRKRM